MEPGTLFLGTFLLVTGLLRFWQKPSYRMELWGFLVILGFYALGGLCDATHRHQSARMFAVIAGTALALWNIARITDVHPLVRENIPVILEGIVTEYPEQHGKSFQCVMRLTASSENLQGGQHVLVQGYGNSCAYGDRIVAHGTARNTSPSDNGYMRTVRSRGIVAILDGKIGIVGREQGNPVFSSLYHLRSILEERIAHVYGEPQGSLLAGILLGSRDTMSRELTETFRRTGLSHITAVSGYNITIILVVLMSLLSFLPWRLQHGTAIACIVAFTLLVGASASVVRASIMGILGLLALQCGRLAVPRRTILITAALMVGWNPRQLWDDASFQLSFLSVIGLLECAPLFLSIARKIPESLGIRESVITTLTAQVAAVPLVMYLFGNLSIVSPIANVLVAPAIPLAMFFGALGILASFLHDSLGLLLGFPGYSALTWIIAIARTFANVPGGVINIHFTNPLWILGYYLLLFFALYQRACTSKL